MCSKTTHLIRQSEEISEMVLSSGVLEYHTPLLTF